MTQVGLRHSTVRPLEWYLLVLRTRLSIPAVLYLYIPYRQRNVHAYKTLLGFNPGRGRVQESSLESCEAVRENVLKAPN